MSIFKTNKFFRVIKHFILALPLMFVLGVSLYTIVNPNAKDSYSGQTNYEISYKYQSNEVNSVDDLIVGNIYRFTIENDVLDNYMGFLNDDGYLFLNFINIIDYDFSAYEFDLSDIISRVFTPNGYISLQLYITNQQTEFNIFLILNGDNDYFVSFTTFDLTYDNFTLIGDCIVYDINNVTLFDTDVMNYTDYNVIESVDIDSSGTLDNAFTYAMNEFNQIGFGKFDFVSWFNGIFTEDINNVYLTFINDYINYYLMVECIYFVPWVVHTFIHFAYDLGDYFTSSFKRNKKEDD